MPQPESYSFPNVIYDLHTFVDPIV